MNDLLKKIGELAPHDQQKLLMDLVTSNPPEVQQALLLPTVMVASRLSQITFKFCKCLYHKVGGNYLHF